MENDRPKSINVIGVAGIIYGVLIITAGFGGLFQSGRILHPLLYCIVLVAFGISLILSSSYVIGLRKWARKLSVAQMDFLILCGGYYWWTGFRPWSFFLLVMPAALCLYYLTRPKVKALFK